MKKIGVERAKRYKDKLNLISTRIEDTESWTAGYEAQDFLSDKKTMLAVYKAAQEVVEASMDIVAMACKDSSLVPKDDYANIESLKGVIGVEVASALIEANGLRNRLVHRYNQLDDRLAYESIETLLPYFEEFVGVMEEWLKKNL